MSKYIGIDIAKQTFDVYCSTMNNKHTFAQYQQNKTGFTKLVKEFGKDKTYVMEATGPYSMQLARFLYKQGIQVSVVNPLIIKRFSQMLLQRAKTDKKDAKVIHDYAKFSNVKLWSPPPKEIHEMNQIMTGLQLLHKQHNGSSNQLKAFTVSGIIDPVVKKALNSIVKKFEKEIKRLEDRLNEIIDLNYARTKALLTSINGIGVKAAAMLIATTNNFEKFENYKQLIAYIGLSPRIFESGTSVKGKGHICKMGNSNARKILYMCAWSAKRHNKNCMNFYNRLKEKGKPEKVIKVAIANKLLKIAFSVVKNDTIYDENYLSNRGIDCNGVTCDKMPN
ncbi:MAG: IS110 family transposase [Bacteroidales bacterium]|jgi:transposase|nr:IS110 family transposase [Bacteroidales bacterium]